MSDLANRAAALAPVTTAAQIADLTENPLRLLPAEWRAPVWCFWSKWASLLRSQLDLAASLREWIVEDGLTLEEAESAFRVLTRPERRGLVQFPGQVVAELAKEVATILARRKSREEQARRRADDQVGEALRVARWTPEKPN